MVFGDHVSKEILLLKLVIFVKGLMLLKGVMLLMKRTYLRRTAIIAAVGILLLVSAVLPANANNLQQQLNDARQSREQLNRELTAQQGKVAQFTPQVEALRDSVDVLNNAIKQEQAKLTQEQNNLKALEEEQARLEERRQRHIEHLGEFVRNSHEDGISTYLEILFDATSLADFIDRADKVQLIAGVYKQLQEDIAAVNETLDEQKTVVLQKQEEIRAVLAEKEQSQRSLQQTLARQEEILSQLTRDERAAVSAVAAARTNISRLEEAILHEQREAAYAARQRIDPGSDPGGGTAGTVIISGGAQAILDSAAQHLGTPYVWGGTTPSGFDCSGFVQYVFRANGVSLSRTSQQQFRNGVSVNKSDLRAGDLVFFTTYGPGATHVGIYVSNNTMIHSGSRGIVYTDITNEYYAPRYLGARRVLSQ